MVKEPTVEAVADGSEAREDVFPVPETRGIRYAIAESATADTLLRDFTLIAENGFNAVVVGAFIHGYTLYPSPAMKDAGLAPIHPAFRRRDPLAEALEAAEEVGLFALGRVETLHIGDRPLRRAGLARRRPEWTVMRNPARAGLLGGDGRRAFLNPAQEDARRLLGDVFHEIVERYPVQGLFLNDLRYPRGLNRPEPSRQARDLHHFRRERAREGRHAAPAFDESDPVFREWQAWRNAQLDSLLRYLHCRMERASAFNWIVSQAVGPYDAETANSDLQGDWKRWLTDRTIDAAAPRYPSAVEAGAFREALLADLAALPDDAGLYPQLEAADLRDGAARIEVTRDLPLPGLFIRSFDDMTEDDWRAARERFFDRPARPVEEDPLAATRRALMECRRLLESRGELADFFADLLKVVPQKAEQRGRGLDTRLTQSIAENLRGIETRLEEGAISLGGKERVVRRWIALARRCLALALR